MTHHLGFRIMGITWFQKKTFGHSTFVWKDAFYFEMKCLINYVYCLRYIFIPEGRGLMKLALAKCYLLWRGKWNTIEIHEEETLSG